MGNEVRARAYRVGIAGPVGSGKTALVDRLSKELYPARNLSPDVWKFRSRHGEDRHHVYVSRGPGCGVAG